MSDPVTQNTRSTRRPDKSRAPRSSITTVRFVLLGVDLPAQEARHGSLRFGASNGVPFVKKT
jgi:hypothetical protein